MEVGMEGVGGRLDLDDEIFGDGPRIFATLTPT